MGISFLFRRSERHGRVAAAAVTLVLVAGVVPTALVATTTSAAQAGAPSAPEPETAAGDAEASAGEGEPSAQARALAQAAESGERVEVVEAATETETLWANPSGDLTLEVAQEPVRVETAAGDLVDIDTTLEPAGGGVLEPVATTTDLEISATGTSTALAQVNDQEADFGIGLDYAGDLGAPTVQDSTATFVQDGDTSVRVTALDQGFAAHVLLEKAPSEAPVYRFPLRLDGVDVRLSGGVLEFTDTKGSVVATSAQLLMWDASTDDFGDPANPAAVNASLVEDSGETVLELRPSMEYLTDPDTVYPVTVDPDVTIGGGNDAYVTDATPNQGYLSSWSLRAGSNNGTDRYRSWINFDASAYAGKSIESATLELYQYAAGTCNKVVSLTRCK